MIHEDGRRRLDTLDIGGAWRRGFDQLADRAVATTELPPMVAEVGLAMAYAGRGMETESRHHGERALGHGMTRPQVVEALGVGLLHGGYGIFWSLTWMIEAAPAAPWVGDPAAAHADTASVQRYFEGVWGGSLPAWLRLAGEADQDMLTEYYRLRTDILGEGALAKRHKELLIALMSCVEHYDFGIDTHIRNALAAGASRAEVVDTVRVAVVAGGIVAWVAGFELAAKALQEAGK